MKIAKKPKHWPYVSPDQQLDGMKFTVSQADIDVFRRAMKVLVLDRIISKSKRTSLIKNFRKIAGLSK